MNLEPTYVFVKGKGWEPTTQPFESRTLVNGWGEKLTIIARKPEAHERGIYALPENHLYVLDGKPNLKNWAEMYVRAYKYMDYKYPHEYDGSTRLDEAVWITVVKCD